MEDDTILLLVAAGVAIYIFRDTFKGLAQTGSNLGTITSDVTHAGIDVSGALTTVSNTGLQLVKNSPPIFVGNILATGKSDPNGFYGRFINSVSNVLFHKSLNGRKATDLLGW
jgi:hypothetical protein